jgi:tetratricopeptide (TPR) repeat protein
MSYNRPVIPPAVLAGLLALSALPSAAQDNAKIHIDHQEWRVVGWNDACGVALTVLSYPKLGEALVGEPISTRAGVLTIPTGKDDAATNWTLAADGPFSFSQKDLDKAESDLRRGGFNRAGYPETILDVPVGDQPLLAEAILSTGTLSPRLKNGWPGYEWRWSGANYNGLATCGLLVYENREDPRHYRFLLLRVYNPRTRTDRGYAHASNARLLFNAGNLDAGAAEAETAALLAPDLPIARYEHAAMLALTGRADLAMDELKAAVKLDPKYGAKARSDEDFAELRGRDDFKDATR